MPIISMDKINEFGEIIFLPWLIFLCSLIPYFIFLEIYRLTKERKITSEAQLKGTSRIFVLKELDNLRMNISRFRLGLTKTNFILVVINLILASISIASFRQNIEIDSVINRPYITIDSSKISKQLSVYNVIETSNDKPAPYNNSFSFSIKNVGKIPAKYSTDTSNFNLPGMEKLLPLGNESGVIFPEQSIEIKYDVQGFYTKESSIADSNRISAIIDGNISLVNKIKVIYGYIDDNNFEYETYIQEKIFENNCSEAPTPRLKCFINPTWVMTIAN